MGLVFITVLSYMLALSSATSAISSPVWPPPQSMQQNGPPRALSPDFRVKSVGRKSMRLSAAISRHIQLVKELQRQKLQQLQQQQQQHTHGRGDEQTELRVQPIDTLVIQLASTDETLHVGTVYNYTLRYNTSSSTAMVTAHGVYGAMYALETFSQLLLVNDTAARPSNGDGDDMLRLVASAVEIIDGPQYAWRGLMIDSGRRFFPVDLVKNLIDTMAANKLNVLHLHASDHCRFGVESKKYPQLTSSLTGVLGGFYTQTDVAEMIAYAKDRGVRVVPEFDIPGHSRGFLPLEGELKFCTDSATRSQLYNDPAGATYGVLHEVLQEMASLFEDKAFHIGCDETRATGPCTINSTAALETKLLTDIYAQFGKNPEGWDEVLLDAGAATSHTIIDAWRRGVGIAEVIASGHVAVNSDSSQFYFTSPAPGGPAGWSKCWYDIATGLNSTGSKLLLGGEMSMWTDTYCYIDQCGSSAGPPPVGHALFSPDMDKEFAASVGGMIWPRGYVAAGAFWSFSNSTDPSSPAFVKSIGDLNAKLIARGAHACPNGCSCDQLTA
eukprot:UC1_evm1s1975